MVPGATGLKCDSTETINEGFGDGYQTALDAANALDKNFEVNMQYKVILSYFFLVVVLCVHTWQVYNV